MIIYRLDLSTPPEKQPIPDGRCEIASGLTGVLRDFPIWMRNWGVKNAVKTALKVLTGTRILYCSVTGQGTIAQSGWANIGFCQYYRVESDAVVFGTLLTRPEFRRKGYATAAKTHVINYLFDRGHTRFYSDTTPANIASQRTSEKLGFQKIAELDIASPAA